MISKFCLTLFDLGFNASGVQSSDTLEISTGKSEKEQVVRERSV